MLLLTANPGEAADWDAVAGPLTEAGVTVIRMDWPGYGASPLPARPEQASASAYAKVLGEVLDALDELALGPYVLIGNSVGGYAALRQGLDRPDRVRALVLVDPAGFTRLNPITRGFCRLMGTPRAARHLIGPLAWAYLRRRTATSSAILARARSVRTDAGRLAVHCSVWRSFLDPAVDLRADAGRLTVPVLLTWGVVDPVLPWLTDGRAAARCLPNVETATFWCGHEPHAETPARWLAAVTAFLTRVDVIAGTPIPP